MSPEHIQARVGRATSSEFADILARGKGITRAKYLRRLVAERLTGKPSETYHNHHMDRGIAEEPYARMAYEAATGSLVEETGFIKHEALEAGCSPDGLRPDRGVEIKCVLPTVQVETIVTGGYPTEHKAQIMGGLWVTKLPRWDFCSYCPEMPEHLRCYIFTVERDDLYIARLAVEVRSFLGEVDNICKMLNERK